MISGGEVLGLALERSETPKSDGAAELRYDVVVREGHPDNPFFYTSPYLIKILEDGTELRGKRIGHILYTEKTPGQRVFSPTILTFEKIFAQTSYPYFKDKGI